MSQQRTVRMLFAAVHGSVHDAVDGSSTGTRVPKMWALFKAPRWKARTTTVRPDRQVCNVRHNDPMAKNFAVLLRRKMSPCGPKRHFAAPNNNVAIGVTTDIDRLGY